MLDLVHIFDGFSLFWGFMVTLCHCSEVVNVFCLCNFCSVCSFGAKTLVFLFLSKKGKPSLQFPELSTEYWFFSISIAEAYDGFAQLDSYTGLVRML